MTRKTQTRRELFAHAASALAAIPAVAAAAAVASAQTEASPDLPTAATAAGPSPSRPFVPPPAGDVVTSITDPKIHIEEHWHDHPVTGQVVRLLVLLAPLDRWFAIPEAERACWHASQVGRRLVQAHRISFA